MPRLAKDQYQQVLDRFAKGESLDDLAVEYNLSRHQCYHIRNRETVNAKRRAWVEQNRELHNARCRVSKRKNWDKYLVKNNASNRAAYSALKAAAISRLGGMCVLCGYNGDIRALQIDHINSDGAQDRKARKGNQWQLYKEIIEFGGQDKYQCLCANCNQIKRMEAGEHPPGRKRQ